jgi:PleD family two-component response regulator
MKVVPHSQNWDNRNHSQEFNCALIIGGAGDLRGSVITRLREHGWLVHGASRAEQAFSVLAHIPYNLIVLDSELPGISVTELVQRLRRLRDYQGIRLVVINDSGSTSLESPIGKCGAFLARRSMWEHDLFGFLGLKEEVLG